MWQTAKLGDICDVRRGTTITKKDTIEGGVPVIAGGTKPAYFHNKANRKAGCITVSGSGASAGYVSMWDVPIFASDCATIEVKDKKTLQRFVYYFMQARQEFIYENFRSGAAQPHVYAKDIATLDFPIVPLADQQRIVAKLDAAFAEIDEAIALAEAKEAEIEKLKAGLLSSLLNDDALLWTQIPFENCIQKTKTPFKLPKKEYAETGDYPVVSQEAILVSGYDSEASHVFNVSKPVVIFGDHTQVLKYVDFDFVVGADGIKILLPVEGINTKYFYYVLQAIMPKTKGYARHYRLLKDLSIPLPPLADQKRIVAKLDAAFAEIASANAALTKMQTNYTALKSGILAQALESEAA